MREISGVQIAEEIIERIKNKSFGNTLIAVMAGNDIHSQSFLRQKARASEKAGISFKIAHFSEKISGEDLKGEVGVFVRNSQIGGIIIQLPLPPRINAKEILNVVPKEKDADVLSEKAFQNFFSGGKPIPPPIGVIQEILFRENFSLPGKKIVVVGKGMLVGKPISAWIEKSGAEMKILEKGDDLSPAYEADLLILGAGSPHLLKANLLKKGAAVIDFGCGFAGNRIVGDLEASSGPENLSFYTPTPGGTGPILVAKLLENFTELCRKN